MNVFKRLAGFLIILGGVILPLPLIHAEAFTTQKVDVVEANDFVVEPAKIEIFADPGETVTKSVSIVDRIPGESHFILSLEDFVGSDDPNIAVKLLGSEISRYSFRNNIKPETSDFTLNFGERATIPVTITVPKDASPGGYYTSVVVSHMPQDGAPGNGARTISRVAQLLFVRVNGDVTESGSLKDFTVSPTQFVHTKGPLSFEILFQNDGNVHLAPYGIITVKNLFGGIVAQLPVDAYYSLPESQRYREVEWNSPFLLGYYTATLELNDGYKESEKIETRTTSFVFVPLLYIGILLLLGIVAFATRRYVRKNFELKRK